MEVIKLAHGSGGRLTHELIENIIYEELGNNILLKRDDASCLKPPAGKLAVTTDSFVISPIFFSGGDIGKLSVCGTVNDLAANGAYPLYLTLSFILEEGLEIAKFKQIVSSIAKTAGRAGVKVVTGDTKVVKQGEADQIYINTTGLGAIKQGINLAEKTVQPGDKVIVNGSLGDHGASILADREGFDFKHNLKSDCSLLHDLIDQILAGSKGVKFLRDPTRGGLATTLNEIANEEEVRIKVWEDALSFKPGVEALGEILGVDPLYLASEGRMVMIVDKKEVGQVVDIMVKESEVETPKVIGEVTAEEEPGVDLVTELGGTKELRMLNKELLPRIC